MTMLYVLQFSCELMVLANRNAMSKNNATPCKSLELISEFSLFALHAFALTSKAFLSLE